MVTNDWCSMPIHVLQYVNRNCSARTKYMPLTSKNVYKEMMHAEIKKPVRAAFQGSLNIKL